MIFRSALPRPDCIGSNSLELSMRAGLTTLGVLPNVDVRTEGATFS